jgi:hypothetical protein
LSAGIASATATSLFSLQSDPVVDHLTGRETNGRPILFCERIRLATTSKSSAIRMAFEPTIPTRDSDVSLRLLRYLGGHLKSSKSLRVQHNVALKRLASAVQLRPGHHTLNHHCVVRHAGQYGITVILMRFHFDERKSRRLRANPKRGIGFEEAQEVFSHPYYLDQRTD